MRIPNRGGESSLEAGDSDFVYVFVFRGTVGSSLVDIYQDFRIMTSGIADAYVAQGLSFVSRMVDEHGIKLSDAVLVGHSLGAHVAAEVARLLSMSAVSASPADGAAGPGSGVAPAATPLPVPPVVAAAAASATVVKRGDEPRAGPGGLVPPRVVTSSDAEDRPPVSVRAVAFCLPYLSRPRPDYHKLVVVNVFNDVVSRYAVCPAG